ncbi:TMEM43 family protein [Oleiagrimonas sp.]|uniref:TMEM43 family protein n=1 Tax=Oleiagrimonas sp. TaxID=2010330 RepID=UPI00261D3B76|nr:TMEM43 family protein [Oleiagrimonas sp.]
MLVAGGAILLASMAILATNEKNVITYRQAAMRHGGYVFNATDSGPTSGNEGDMVRVAGTPVVVKPAVDTAFGVRANAPILRRKVEMFQWQEDEYAGQTSYEMDWYDYPVDWTVFKQPYHHRNPSSLPFGRANYLAGAMTLRGFTLSPAIMASMPGRVPVVPDFSHLHPNLAASFRIIDGKLLSSRQPDSPQLGDLRVSWTVAPLQPVTIIARNRDGVLVPARNVDNEPGFELQVGIRQILDLQPDLPAEPWLPWVWRVLALVLAGLGAHVLLRGISAGRADLLAAATIGITLTFGLASVMWIVVVPKTGAVLIGIAVLCLVITAWRLSERAA